MSISTSLQNALSGLTAASRAAQLVSNNVANVMTEGYGRREIQLSSRILDGAGAGVAVDGVVRVVDQGILRDRRLADAALGFFEGQASFLSRVEELLGSPDLDNSISGRLRNFEASLIEAASRPDSDVRLGAVLAAAGNLITAIRDVSDGIQGSRLEADREIAVQVERLNTGLAQVQDLNAAISRLNGAGRDVSALEDQRQRVIDGIAGIVPIREVPRDDGKISLYTTGGAILLDDTARTIDFTPVNFITPDMTIESGALYGLSIDGRAVRAEGTNAPLGGGSLAALFETRDRLAVTAQADLDAFARDLVERFEAPGVDPTAAPGAPGLFTDSGAAFAAADEVGLSARLELNAAADPNAGGETWRLRDGLGAAVQGPVGFSGQLQSFADAINGSRTVASGAAAGTSRTLHTLSSDLVSRSASERTRTEAEASFAMAEQTSLRAMELSAGVDTDQEMQKLLLIEQAYAANARVIQTVDGLLQSLLAI